ARRRRLPVQPAVALLAVLVLLGVPFAVVILTAGKSKAEALEPNLALPSTWHYLENFTQVLSEGRMLAAFLGSVLVIVPAVAIVLVFGAMASWILARRKSLVSSLVCAAGIRGIARPPAAVTADLR